jgi:hypothetical protein
MRRHTRQIRFYRRVGVALCVAALAALSVCSAVVSASELPRQAWALQVIASPSSFVSDRNGVCETEAGDGQQCDHYTIIPANDGAHMSEGPVTVIDTLPEGVTTIGTPHGSNEFMEWQCATETPGSNEVVTCTSGGEVPALTHGAPITMSVGIAPGTPGPVVNHAAIAGGGAEEVSSSQSTLLDQSPPAFQPLEYAMEMLDTQGRVATRAGSHPGSLTVTFGFPTAFSSILGRPVFTNPTESVRQIVTDLPVGIVGDAQAAATCPLLQVTNLKGNQKQCPTASKVGTLALTEPGGVESELTIFNVAPEKGYAAEFAVFLPSLNRAVLLYGKLVGSGGDAHVRVVTAPQDSVANIMAVSLTFFGNPSLADGGSTSPLPFFTAPSDCSESAGFTSRMYVDTWQHPGSFEPSGAPNLADPDWKEASSVLPAVTGCGALRFQPSFTFAPEAEHSGADEPAGYEASLTVPQNLDVNGLATPPLRTTIVTLPPGVSLSPSAAVGLVGCELGAAGIGLSDLSEESTPGHCPAASRVGSVEATTPLLKQTLTGGVYVAQPSCGGAGQGQCSEAAVEEGNVFSIYMELGNEEAGVHIKLKGKVEVGGEGHRNGLSPGQVRTTVAETPQQPVSGLNVKFTGGPSAALANPQTCGAFTSAVSLESWSHVPAPGEATGTPIAIANPSFVITGCESRFSPIFVAGTVSARAGAYSPLTVTITRHDREGDLRGVAVEMPAGLIAKIAGVSECDEASANEGTCAAASGIGSVTAGAGPGPAPLWQRGAVYFTGPYHGAPFGLSIVVPAKAGPYNLGNIVVRAALFVDPTTAQVRVVSDPLPQSVDGVPIRLKSVNVTVDRGEFALNPTSCTETSIGAALSSASGSEASAAARFQAQDCANLGFGLKLAATTAATSSKVDGASLVFKFTMPAHATGAQSWLRAVKLELPKQLPARLTTLQRACPAATFDANPATCPPASRIGTATVRTPVLSMPLTGPVFFVSHGGAKFPDAVIVLQGDGITVDLTGETFVNGKTGVTSVTFLTIPDVPFESAEVSVPQGPFSEFAANLPSVANRSFCGERLSMPTVLVAQNGKEIHNTTSVGVSGCSGNLAVRSRKPRGRTLSLVVYVPASGRLTVSGRHLRLMAKSVVGTQLVSITAHARAGQSLRGRVVISFKPIRGKRQTRSLALR